MGLDLSKYYLTEAPITSLYNEILFGKSGVAMATWFSLPSFHKFSGTFVDWFLTFAVAMRVVVRLNLRKVWNILEAIVYVFTKSLFWICWHFIRARKFKWHLLQCLRCQNSNYFFIFFRTLVDSQMVSIHPSSALFHRQPEWVVYHEVVQTTKEYMREVTAIGKRNF